jgi:HD-GYP domain-containing protein (c-di-GMP phosphodiesterase class II)
MAIDYKKELETAAKGMILVHEPNLLAKMIARTIVHRVKVSHTAILLHEKDKNTYILNVSRGPVGLKIPQGFTRMDFDNPLIRFFRERKDKELLGDGTFVYQDGQRLLASDITPSIKELVKNVLYQMDIYGAVTCIPSYFRNELMAVLLLGKKNDGQQFGRDELDFLSALASDVAMAIRNAHLFKDLETELEKRKHLYIHTTVALAAAIEAKDDYTHGHTSRVTSLSLEIANYMARKDKKFADAKFLENLHIASLLHDIGKIGIPESILNKVEPLTNDEWKIIKEHPMIGVNILQPIKELAEAVLGVKHHHERYDGSGYPQGLKAEEIPLIAAVISVADAYDAMTTNRIYRLAKPKEVAIEEIRLLSGKQFHPEIANAFIELCRTGKSLYA